MAETPVIHTQRLALVPFCEEHLTTRYTSWLNDPEVVRYSNQRFKVHTLASCREYWQSFVETPNYFWAMIEHEKKMGHIGNLNAYVDPIHKVADIGILVGEQSAWKQGYGLEAWNAICNYLLNVVGMRKVTAGTLSINTAMLALMHSAQMVDDGRRIRQCLYEGSEIDVIHMARFQMKSVR